MVIFNKNKKNCINFQFPRWQPSDRSTSAVKINWKFQKYKSNSPLPTPMGGRKGRGENVRWLRGVQDIGGVGGEIGEEIIRVICTRRSLSLGIDILKFIFFPTPLPPKYPSFFSRPIFFPVKDEIEGGRKSCGFQK